MFFEMVFSFSFWFGKSLFGLASSSPIFDKKLVSNVFALGLAMVAVAFLAAILNLTLFCPLLLMTLKLAWICPFCHSPTKQNVVIKLVLVYIIKWSEKNFVWKNENKPNCASPSVITHTLGLEPCTDIFNYLII